MSNSSPQAFLELLSTLDRLDDLPRTGWLFSGVDRPESIAAHSYGVCLVALWIADHIDEPLDLGQLLRMALLHDIAESMLTDLPRPVKDILGDAALHDAEDLALDRLLQTDTDHPWKRAHDDYRHRQSLEAKIVKAGDQIQMLHKALLYRHRHNAPIDDFFSPRDAFDDHGIALIKDLFDHLFDCFHNHRLPRPHRF